MLSKILQHKMRERSMLKSNANSFMQLFNKKNASIIAEIKIASPQFDWSTKIDVDSLIQYYGTNDQISAISILIDRKYFKGDISHAYTMKKYAKPIFFKEFVIEESQIYGAAYWGYDAALLIEKILNPKQIFQYVTVCFNLNIFPIIEVDNESALQFIFSLSLPKNVGIAINARNLDTLHINSKIHEYLAHKYRQQFTERYMFAFSGYNTIKDTKKLHGLYDGVLIGTGLIKDFIGQISNG